MYFKWSHICPALKQSAGVSVPPGAGLAEILHVTQIDGRPMPRLLRSLLWLGWIDFGYRTVVWLSSLLLLVRATEPACQHQVRALVGAGPAGRVCQKSDMGNCNVPPFSRNSAWNKRAASTSALRQPVTSPEGCWWASGERARKHQKTLVQP